MSNLNHSKALYFSYVIVNLAWYAGIAMCVLFPVIVFLAFTGGPEYLQNSTLSFPISTQVILFSPDSTIDFMNIDSAVASVKLGYLAEYYPSTFFIVSVLIFMAELVVIYGVYQLRSILRDLKSEQVFTPTNMNRIKKTSISILALSPVGWLYHTFLSAPFGEYMQEHRVEINVGSADFGFITAALLIYVLALIFEKGYEQYQELKLTV
ncbi:MAG: DUF2975 domain-containing protein [Balneolaceae bacterium]|nr:DUF2975 domain-containing protein [Balneolaceae bacterium]